MRSTFFDQMEKNRALADDLLEHSKAWIEDVDVFRSSVQKLLDHPFLASLGSLDGSLGEPGSERSGAEEPVGVLLYELATCAEQGQICEVMARANGGVVDLKRAAPLIRWAGLSEAKDDPGLIKNLGARLLRTGRWVRCGESVLRWLDWRSHNRPSLAAGEGVDDLPTDEELVPVGDDLNGKHDPWPESRLELRNGNPSFDDSSALNE